MLVGGLLLLLGCCIEIGVMCCNGEEFLIELVLICMLIGGEFVFIVYLCDLIECCVVE